MKTVPFTLLNASQRRRFLLFGLIYIALWVGTWYSARLLESLGGVSLWFLPAGLRFFCLLVFGWLGVLLELAVQAVFALMQIASIEGVPIDEILSINTFWRLYNLLGSLIATSAIVFPLRGWMRERLDFSQPSHSSLFLLAALGASVLSALVGTFGIVQLDFVKPAQFSETFLAWMIGDFIGIITLTPLLLVRLWPGLRNYLEYGHRYGRDGVDGTALYNDFYTVLIAGLALGLVFGLPWSLNSVTHSPLIALLLLIPLGGVALRFGLSRSVLATMLLDGGLVILITLFDLHGDSLSYQFVMILVAVVGMWLGSASDANKQLLTARRELVESVRRYTELYAFAPVGYFTLSRLAEIVESNVAGSRLLGITRHRLKGRYFGDFVTASTRPIFDASIQAALATGLQQTCEVDLIFQDPTQRTVSIQTTHSADGQEYRVVVTDVTDKKRVEQAMVRHQEVLENEVQLRTEALSISKEAAETASRAKSVFLATMSHELRTPMNAIMGMTELARRKATDPKQIDQLDKVTTASKHLLAIINDILDISRIEAEKLTLDETNFNVRGVMEHVLALVEYRIKEKELKLKIDLPAEIARLALRGDPFRLGQILLNVFDNAIKFTASGGITVTVSLIEKPPGAVLLRFEIEDTGIGIDAEDVSRLFSPFEQLDGSMTRKYGGTGLGLAISRRLARLMNGDMGVSSQPGSGSTFWVTVCLPKVPAEVLVSSIACLQDKPRGSQDASEVQLKKLFNGAYILLVEDEPLNQMVARILLEEAGLQVDVAEDGESAVEMANRKPYSLILMDVQLPKLDGIAAARAIRAMSINESTPIVAMTANAFEDDCLACLAAGMNDHLAKPVLPELLFATVLKWLLPSNAEPHNDDRNR